MRSAARVLVAALVLGGAVGWNGVTEAATAASTATAAPTEKEIAEAVEKLQADRNLGATAKRHRLQWVNGQQRPEQKPSDWMQWLAQAAQWFASTARALLWVLGVLVVGILGMYIKRFLELRGGRSITLKVSLPTHVRDLDIRPESLPDDIGATALGLWERSEHRAALSLLYRGTLSRLAHVHGVPIRDSSTEGDCLQLASTHVAPTQTTYVSSLIRLWQRAVYGGLDPTDEAMRSLCAGFGTAMDKPLTAAPLEQAA